MSIEVNGVTLPDIPSEVLEQYPYAVIASSSDGTYTNYSLQMCVGQAYFAPAELAGYDQVAAVAYGGVTYIAFAGDAEWTVSTGPSDDVAIYIPLNSDSNNGYITTVVWSNHDILTVTAIDESTGEITTGEIYFARNDSDPNYFAPKSWFDGMAQQVRRLAGTSDKLTTTEMLELAKGVEVGGGLAENERIYQVGTAASTLDGSTLIFESTAS